MKNRIYFFIISILIIASPVCNALESSCTGTAAAEIVRAVSRNVSSVVTCDECNYYKNDDVVRWSGKCLWDKGSKVELVFSSSEKDPFSPEESMNPYTAKDVTHGAIFKFDAKPSPNNPNRILRSGTFHCKAGEGLGPKYLSMYAYDALNSGQIPPNHIDYTLKKIYRYLYNSRGCEPFSGYKVDRDLLLQDILSYLDEDGELKVTPAAPVFKPAPNPAPTPTKPQTKPQTNTKAKSKDIFAVAAQTPKTAQPQLQKPVKPIHPDQPMPSNKPAGMVTFEDKPNRVRFLRPEIMYVETDEAKTRFINKNKSAYITYESMAYEKDGGKYSDSLAMCQYLLAMMQEHFEAKQIGKITKVDIGGLAGHQIHYTWKMDGRQLEQVEIAFDGAEKMFTLGILASPEKFQKFIPDFIAMLDSLDFQTVAPPVKKPQQDSTAEKKDTTIVAFVDSDLITGQIEKEPITVMFSTEKSGDHTIECKTMNKAPVMIVLYDMDGNQIDVNFKDAQLFKGFTAKLEARKSYFFFVVPFNDDDVGKSFGISLTTN